MKRREFNERLAAAIALIMSPFPRARNAGAAAIAGATPVFSYPNGFVGSSSAIHLCDNAILVGSAINLINYTGTSNHNHGGAWYATQQPPSSFTTQFTFQMISMGSSPTGAGMTFCIQNTVSPPGLAGYVGDLYAGDANMCGYGGLVGQYPPADSIAVKFDANAINAQPYPTGGFPNSTGLYFNGGPSAQSGTLGLTPFNDLNPYGINFYNGNVMSCTIVYDGSLLTMVLVDTATGAQAREVWPLNLAHTTNANGNYVGFTGGTDDHGTMALLTWTYWSGYNTRLPTPTFSPAPGQYSGAQSVTFSYPAGSTCYYTTNGLLPTGASTKYTGPITVSANEVIQAVAIQSGYTDSLVGVGAYQIGTSNVINLTSGFAANDGVIPCGYAYKSGSSLVLTDNAVNSTIGSGWFCNPVNIQSGFTTTFQVHWNGGANGMCFVIQNNPPAYPSASNAVNWSGGPTAVAQGQTALGYGGLGSGTSVGLLNSLGIAFDLWTVPNSVGLYTNGATPIGSQRATGLTFNGHTFNVTISYSGTTLSLSMTDTSTSAHYTTSWSINIPSTVGANTAYVGFTAGTGGGTAIQEVLSWTYASGQTSAVPAAPTNLRVQ